MGTRSAGYSAVQQWWNSFLDILEVTRLCSHHFHIIAARSHKSTELDHFHIIAPRSIPSPRRTAQVHRARPLRLMARGINKAFTATAFCWFQNAASRCLCWQNTRAARLRVLGCRLLGEPLCADDDSLVSRIPRINTNTHCHSGNISKMHDFSEIMENGSHVLDYPVLGRLLRGAWGLKGS